MGNKNEIFKPLTWQEADYIAVNGINTAVKDVEGSISKGEFFMDSDPCGEATRLTHAAMNGDIQMSFQEVTEERLRIISPREDDLRQMDGIYLSGLAPDTLPVIELLEAAGIKIVMVTRGFRQAIPRLEERLDVPFYVNDLYPDRIGDYIHLNDQNLLMQPGGKRLLIEDLLEQGIIEPPFS